jgi:hypothetical protein
LGKETKYDHIEVGWPDGLKETFPGGVTDVFLTLRRGEGVKP